MNNKMDENIKWLIDNCNSFSVEVNENNRYYQSISDYMQEKMECFDDCDYDLLINKDKPFDNLIELQVYPDTPIGFYNFIGNDLDMLVEAAVKAVKQDRVKK